MYKAEYLSDKDYFDSFEDVKKYYEHPEAVDVDDLNRILKEEADGMVSPVVSEV